ncbi:MAG: thioredoxin domain-containing protein [Patescibacteria group bacterium]|jgi:protein-disulfide isomerase
MNLLKKYWWILATVAVILIVYFVFFSGPKVEYAELNTDPHIFGNPEASVVLTEFSDFQCPACGLAYTTVKVLMNHYADKIKFQYRHFPLSSIHPYAFKAAVASECASDQGKFWEYHDLLFVNQQALTKADLLAYAGKVEGLDVALWQDCLASGVKEARVQTDIATAKKEGYNSTPTFILNGQKVADWGTLPEMVQALIEPLVPLKQSDSTK